MSEHQHHPEDHMVFDDSKAEEYVKEQIVQSNAEHVVSCVKRYLKPGSEILDFGCGPGVAARKLAALPEVKSVLGADVSEGMLGQFNKLKEAENEEVRAKLTSLKTSPNPVEELKPHVGTKDMVIISYVIGHLHPREAGYDVVKKVAACLKPGGHFILAEFKGGIPYHGEDGGHQHGHSHGHGHGEGHGHGHEHSHDGHEIYHEDQLHDLLAQAGMVDTKTEMEYQFHRWNVDVDCIVISGLKKVYGVVMVRLCG